jgi:hypothetical protein
MEAIYSSEMSADSKQTARIYIPEDYVLIKQIYRSLN